VSSNSAAQRDLISRKIGRRRHRRDPGGARLAIDAPLVQVGQAESNSGLARRTWAFQRRRIEDESALLGFRWRIWSLAAVGVVFATPALYLGLVYFQE